MPEGRFFQKSVRYDCRVAKRITSISDIQNAIPRANIEVYMLLLITEPVLSETLGGALPPHLDLHAGFVPQAIDRFVYQGCHNYPRFTKHFPRANLAALENRREWTAAAFRCRRSRRPRP